MMEAGTYYATLTDAGMDQSSGGTPCMRLGFNVTHQASNGAWVEIQATERSVYLYTTDKAFPYTAAKLHDLGFNGDYGNPGFGDNTQTQLVCSHETYEDKDREKWDLPGSGAGERNAPPQDVIRRLNAKHKTQVSAAPPASRPQAPQQPEPVAAVAGDGQPPGDDIPF